MRLIAPDILAEAVGLSPVLCGAGLFLGLMLLLLGWRKHRFWIVLLGTVMAGIYGLSWAPAYGSQRFICGVLAAIASGILALALVRLVAFLMGGVAACLLVQVLAPSWHGPMVWFLVGGLLGVVLFRIWTMALTSLAGSVLMAYSGLCLADRLHKLQAVAWADRESLFLTWACAVVALLGVIWQYTSERRRAKTGGGAPPGAPKKEDKPAAGPAPAGLAWLRKLGSVIYRKAG